MASQGLTGYFCYLLLVSNIGPLLYGYHLAELNVPQSAMTCTPRQLKIHPAGLPQCLPLDTAKFGLVSSIYTLGGLSGALLGGPISARHGRHKGMIFGTFFYILGGFLAAIAPTTAVLTVARAISGVGAGLAIVIVPLFIAEIAPPSRRGFFGATCQVMINVGILVTLVLGYFLSKAHLWRIVLAVGGAIGLAQLIGLLLGGEESPHWLAEQGQEKRAFQILRKIRGQGAVVDDEIRHWPATKHRDEDAESPIAEQETLLRTPSVVSLPKSSRSSPKGLIAVVLDKESRPAVIAIVVIMCAQQLTGINSIVMYGVGVLSSLLGANSALLNIGVAVLNILVTIAGASLSDKLGRKPCLLLSITGMGLSSLALAFAIGRHIPLLSAIAVIAFVTSFALGLGPVPFILSSELVSPDAAASTQSLALASNYVCNYVVAQFFPILNQRLGHGRVYFIFAAVAALSATFITWWVPETMGKEDADEVWGRKRSSVRQE